MPDRMNNLSKHNEKIVMGSLKYDLMGLMIDPLHFFEPLNNKSTFYSFWYILYILEIRNKMYILF